MRKFTIYCFILIFSFANAQNKAIEITGKINREFANQGEQEDFWAEELFRKEYVKQNFKKFNGQIVVSSKTAIKFDDKTLVFWSTKTELIKIFTSGIFYPQLVIGNQKSDSIKTKSELELLSANQQLFYKMSRNDTLKISDFEELEFLSKSPKIKRFRFWHYRAGFVNPMVYFIELTNRKANKNTTIECFIKEAELTFLKNGWLIL